MRLAPWDEDNTMIEEKPSTGTNWGLLLAVGGCLLLWALAVYGLSEMIRR